MSTTPGGFREFEHGLDILRRMPTPVWFRYASATGLPGDVHIGFIAQDVEPVAPFTITRQWSDPELPPLLTIDYVPLIAMLVNTVKELDQRVRVLEAGLSNAK